MNKIAIILTTIERPDSLKKSLNSIITNWQENFVLMIGMQDNYRSESYEVISNIIGDNQDKEIRLYDLEYNCGISKARNELINKAHLWDIPYVLLMADSILFNESIKEINNLLSCLQKSDKPEWDYYDLIGLQLDKRIAWEAKLELIPNQSFQLDFIEKNTKDGIWVVGDKVFNVWPCDIVRNFWLARTDSLIQVPYDEQLIMCEHEDFFWRFKQARMKVGCTNLVSGLYEKGQNTPEYDEIRQTNFRIGMQRLKNKYLLKNWVTYKNLENTKQ